jgi:hypothetical protein
MGLRRAGIIPHSLTRSRSWSFSPIWVQGMAFQGNRDAPVEVEVLEALPEHIGGGVVIGEAEFPAPLDAGVVGVLANDEHQGVLHAVPLPDGRYESLNPCCPHPPGSLIYERVEIGHYSSSL